MLIDWFTVGAQAFNFLILLWLLKRFLYKPILNALDAREKRIANELADANKKKAEAEKARNEFQQRNEEFDRQRANLLSEAKEDAKTERQRLLEEARQAAEEMRIRRQDALNREQQSLSAEITRRAQEEVFAIAGKTLRDLAGIGLEERMSEVFAHRLRTLDDAAKEGLAKALKTSSEPALVRSAFELAPDQKAVIQQALNETFSAEIEIRFEIAPAVISGIEITANGRKVAWSIAEYLASLERSIGELLNEQSQSQAKDKATDGLKPNPGPEDCPADAEAQREPAEDPNPKPEPNASSRANRPLPTIPSEQIA
jgi:F-type H+-transporting ATPase subunit b